MSQKQEANYNKARKVERDKKIKERKKGKERREKEGREEKRKRMKLANLTTWSNMNDDAPSSLVATTA
jgi:hypothetical protein